MYVYIHVYNVCIYVYHACIYIYIYRERERERYMRSSEDQLFKLAKWAQAPTLNNFVCGVFRFGTVLHQKHEKHTQVKPQDPHRPDAHRSSYFRYNAGRSFVCYP